MTVPKAPLIRCSAPGCPVMFRASFRQRSHCSTTCINAEVARRKLPINTILIHPSWERVRQ